jgi:hypothetical protein
MDFSQERLDRIVANQKWCELFPRGEAIVEATLNSNHKPMVLKLQKIDARMGRMRGFRYEVSWGMEPNCQKNMVCEGKKGE